MSRYWVILVLALLPIGGCGMLGFGSNEPAPQPLVFGTANPVPAPAVPSISPSEEQRQAIDRGGVIVEQSPLDRPRVPSATVPPPTTISSTARETVAETAPQAVTVSTAPLIPSASNGQYLTAGGVVIVVSDTPIYADRVLRELTPLLSTEAKNRDINSFKALVASEAEKQVGNIIRTELLFSAAQAQLSEDEKKFAEQRTTEWRQEQVTEAGGSELLARRKARDEGQDFDEKVKDQYRQNMVLIMVQRKWAPRIQVRAQDLRNYYAQHIADFTDYDQAKFRVIKISIENTGTRDAAYNKVKTLIDQSAGASDADFARLASGNNDDPALMRSGGQVGVSDGWLRRGSYIVKQVEDAVWKLQPGEVTNPPIEVNGAFYIARLDARKTGHVRPFEDEQVQETIQDALTRPQLALRREQEIEKMESQAVFQPAQPRLDPVIDLALQMYPVWRAAK